MTETDELSLLDPVTDGEKTEREIALEAKLAELEAKVGAKETGQLPTQSEDDLELSPEDYDPRKIRKDSVAAATREMRAQSRIIDQIEADLRADPHLTAADRAAILSRVETLETTAEMQECLDKKYHIQLADIEIGKKRRNGELDERTMKPRTGVGPKGTRRDDDSEEGATGLKRFRQMYPIDDKGTILAGARKRLMSSDGGSYGR